MTRRAEWGRGRGQGFERVRFAMRLHNKRVDGQFVRPAPLFFKTRRRSQRGRRAGGGCVKFHIHIIKKALDFERVRQEIVLCIIEMRTWSNFTLHQRQRTVHKIHGRSSIPFLRALKATWETIEWEGGREGGGEREGGLGPPKDSGLPAAQNERKCRGESRGK